MVIAAVETPSNAKSNGSAKRGSKKDASMAKAAATTSGSTDPLEAARRKALEQAVGQIERSFGKGSIMKLDDDPTQAHPGISTGAVSLDLALGGRGFPRGRVIEVFGPESSGKTTLALHAIANAQAGGGGCRFYRR